MKCPACGTRNNFYHRYCYFCGEKLGAMIDPPDQEDRHQDQEREGHGGDRELSSYDHDTISERGFSSAGYTENEDYSKESYFTQENTSVDMPEDYFGYPAGDGSAPPTDTGMGDTENADEAHPDDIDYFGYPSPADEDPGRQGHEDIAAGIASEDGYDEPTGKADYPSESPQADTYPMDTVDNAKPSGDPVSSIEEDIAAKISYMEKYMDAYLSGHIGNGQDNLPDAEDDTPIFNDSLDFIRIEEEEPVRSESKPEPTPEMRPEPKQELRSVPKPEMRPEPKPEPRPVPKPETRPEPKPEYRKRPEAPAGPPPPPPPTDMDADVIDDKYDPYEDEETSRMIDMLYQGEPSSRDSSYPRRSRRHTAHDTEPAEEEPDNPDGNIIVKVMIALVIIALMGFAVYVLYNEVFNPNNAQVESSMDLLVTHTLDRDTLEDGTPGQRLTLYAPGAESAVIFGETYTVEDNKVQEFYSDDFLYQQYEAAGDDVQNNEFITVATVYGADDKSIEHEIGFTLSDDAVQLAVFSPEGDRVEVQGDTCTLEISVQSGALLYINDTDYTDQIGPDGLAVINIDVSGTAEMPVHIRASLDGYADAERTITLIPAGAIKTESILTLNESIPVAATSTEVVLTGQVPPGTSIETSLSQSGSPSITENGAFSVTVRIDSRPGYSVCLLRVMQDGTQVDQREVIIDKTATFNEYTTGPWEFTPYESYKNDPALHEGYRFKIPGTVKEIVSQADGLTVCTVDANPGGTEQLIRVWFWGDFSHTAGSSVTVYGNRWGNEEDVPRILAKYIISD